MRMNSLKSRAMSPLLSLAAGDLPVRCFGQRQQSDGLPVATRRGQRFGRQEALVNTSELKWIRVWKKLSIASTRHRTSTVSFDSGTLPLPSVSTEPRFRLQKRTASCFDAFALVEFHRAAIVKRSLQLRPFVGVFFRS